MVSYVFSVLFVGFLLVTLAVRFWLAARHMRHVLAHRGAVPAQFAEKISLAAHQKAADYTVAKIRFGLVTLVIGTVVLVGFTLLGGLNWLSVVVLDYIQTRTPGSFSARVFDFVGPNMSFQLGLLFAFIFISSVIDLPFDYYKQFVLEAKFGFNKMTRRLFVMDLIKGTLLGAALGLPLIWVILRLMDKAGDLWWLYAWMVLVGYQLLVLAIYPNFIAPIFNKFTPLTDDTVRTRIEQLMQRVQFASKGLFVMDGSKRSAHGNAYFSGFGAAKRIVFFDTLLERLAPQEIEAVLAHELGHFKLKHIVKRMIVMFAVSLGFLALLGYLKGQTWFYSGLGADPILGVNNDALALILFALALPVFTFLFSPLTSITSRKHEFEADAFAVKHSNAQDLVNALVKMYDDNASTLTPDPIHSTFYDSHPPASVRINHILAS
jgi:STE24 endopeptidase